MTLPTNLGGSAAQPAPHRKLDADHDEAMISSSFGEDVGYCSAPSSLYSLPDGSTATIDTAASGYSPSTTSSNNTVTPQVTAGPPQTLTVAHLQSMIAGGIEEGYNGDDFDSAYDSESLIGGDTMTLASYITDYRFEHGRRYHAYRDGAYWVSLIRLTSKRVFTA
jgi:hypothetical protein